ncbi:transmembrane and death domain protein 1 [Gopherus flavomarginatus]|uniref:transmembrane and death domain protein 1 n=1 Tax=Gopherus flavomarginatus TaxID=286002 RepID=UPI0021CBA71C|nr:transmembrane and death domain protein 1 [Gopherus flavomarginatus]
MEPRSPPAEQGADLGSGPCSSVMFETIGIGLLLLVTCGSCEDTAADDIGVHMMGRISELLSPEECHEFYTQITGPEENIEEELERLSEVKNPILSRHRRDIVSTEQCKDVLTQWLEAEGDAVYWDRLSRALRQIGRPDISQELGKNVNQDKNLELKRNVEEYHKGVEHLTSSLLLEEDEKYGETNEHSRARRAGGKSRRESGLMQAGWGDIDLIIERKPLPPYNRSLFEWINPVASGFIGGFLISFVLMALAIYSFLWTLNRDTLEISHHNPGPWPERTAHNPLFKYDLNYALILDEDLGDSLDGDASDTSFEGEP